MSYIVSTSILGIQTFVTRFDPSELPCHTAHDSSAGRGAAGVAAAGERACPVAGVRLYRVWSEIRYAAPPRLLRGGEGVEISAISGRPGCVSLGTLGLRRAMRATEPNAQ